MHLFIWTFLKSLELTIDHLKVENFKIKIFLMKISNDATININNVLSQIVSQPTKLEKNWELII